jgi:tetratricopeptide (TPR) repeat protein
MAMAFVLLLGVRTIDNEDVGYHLAFGDIFLDTGTIVDRSPFLYTVQAGPRMEPGPGQWYDAQGQFQFVSANWLTQVVMSAVNRASGAVALSVLQIVLVAAMFGLLLLILRELGLPPLWMASTVVLLGLVSYERLVLRPELFTYVLLAAQMYVLLKATRGLQIVESAKPVRANCKLKISGNSKEPALPLQSAICNLPVRVSQTQQFTIPSWRSVALLCVLQVLLVNVHSYFLLGFIPTAALLGDSVLRTLYFRWRGPADAAKAADARRRSVRLGVTLAAMVACCFINPWTWRMVLLPFQTLLYFRANHITDAGSTHPLSTIGEFYPPLAVAFFYAKATWAFCAVLGVAAIGLLAALLRRRWGHAAIIAMMVVVSLSMRRNIAVASLMLLGPALGAIHDLLAPRLSRRLGPRLAVASACVVAAVSALLVWSVVTDAFHFNERRAARFGLGYSPLKMPRNACDWINVNKPVGRIWCDVDISSNLYYFMQPHRDLPIITNSWAYQPEIMADVIRAGQDTAFFDQEVKKYGIEVVAVRAAKTNALLMKHLGAGDAWAPVSIDAMHVVFVRKAGPDAALAARASITPESLDLTALLAKFAAQDPRPEYSTYLGALTLARLGWTDAAIETARRAKEINPDYADAWNLLGMMSALRANSHLATSKYYEARIDLQAAEDAFQHVLDIQKDDPQAKQNLSAAQGQLQALKRGEVPPVMPLIEL